jgi:hypothetical protein
MKGATGSPGNLVLFTNFRASGVAKVVGEERVTTPAGTFNTYRVDTMVKLLNTRDQTKSQTWTFVFLVCPHRKPMGEKEDGSALRGSS